MPSFSGPVTITHPATARDVMSKFNLKRTTLYFFIRTNQIPYRELDQESWRVRRRLAFNLDDVANALNLRKDRLSLQSA